MATRLLAVLTALALLSLPTAAAQAHPVEHGDAPRLVDAQPVPGDVVPAGPVDVEVVVAGNAAVHAAEVRVDGQPVPSTVVPAGGGQHARVRARPVLEPGSHVVDVVVATAAGEQRRLWRVTAGGPAVQRLAGQGRIETAIAISADRFPQTATATAALLARADRFPDALAAAPLAGALRAPLLLTAGDRLSQPAADELRRVLAPGATVVLLGGEQALSPQVAAQVQALGFAVDRVAGASRAATSVAVAQRVATGTVLVASGANFPDALAASSPAARDRLPILLVDRDGVPAVVAEHLRQQRPARAVVVGGTAAVADAVLTQLRQLVPDVSRIAGDSRFTTAAAVATAFYPRPETVTVASGARFPDALAGGPHAAALGAPLLLGDAADLGAAQRAVVASAPARRAVLYGGAGAVAPALEGALRRAATGGAGPALRSSTPRPAERVETLDDIVLSFDRAIEPAEASVHVTVAGHEVLGVVEEGEFPEQLVFTVAALPTTLQPAQVYEVVVTVAAGAPGAGVDARAAHQVRFSFRKPPATLGRGDRGPEVRELQQRLQAAKFWVGPVDGVYGSLTHQAVLALQKASGLPRDGIYGPGTRAVLEGGVQLPRPRSTSGLWYEVDLEKQVLLLVADGQIAWVFNTSTGHGQVYEFQGSTFRATTTTGRHRVVRQIDGVREAERGRLYRPKYYDSTRGIAIHGAASVPSYPASSGCIRVTDAAMDFLWSVNPGTGAGVWVYPENHYG